MPHPEPGSPHQRSLFHAPTRYALLALIRLPHDGTYRLSRTLAAELDLPGPFLAKILQKLSHSGILESLRGPLGGFRLSRHPEDIPLRDIVLAMEGSEPFEACLLGHPSGGPACQCPIRPAWDQLQELLTTMLLKTSLKDLQLSQLLPTPPMEIDRFFVAPV